MNLTEIILEMLGAGRTKMEITQHLRTLKPEYSPTYLRGYVERVIGTARRQGNDARWTPEPATTG